jgi:hypothetical protein
MAWTRELVLPDTQLLERTAREHFEGLPWVAPLERYCLIEFRDDMILSVSIESLEPKRHYSIHDSCIAWRRQKTTQSV